MTFSLARAVMKILTTTIWKLWFWLRQQAHVGLVKSSKIWGICGRRVSLDILTQIRLRVVVLFLLMQVQERGPSKKGSRTASLVAKNIEYASNLHGLQLRLGSCVLGWLGAVDFH
jgi:hypothetical protein